MHYTSKIFKEKLPEWKKDRDAVIDRCFYRPLSFHVAAFCANCGIKANTISGLSAIVGVVACILIGIPNPVSGTIGSLILIFWIILDDTDGNLARVVSSQPYGEYMDAMSSYILIGFLFLALGIRSFYLGTILHVPQETYLIMGALTSISGVLMSLLYQKFVQVSLAYGKNERLAFDGSNSGRLMKIKTKIDMNLSVGGILPVLITICILINTTELVVIVWFIYHLAEFIATVLYFLQRFPISFGY